MKISELKDKQIAILGMGKEGVSTLRFLLEQGIEEENITLLDKKPIREKTLKNSRISKITGDTYLENLGVYDVIIKSPGVSPFQEALLPYRDKFLSQTQIFFENYPGKVIGITGTKGKSTVSTLLSTLLKAAGYDVGLVGNIGNPVLDEIDFTGEVYDYVIYELSSYMLQDFTPKLEYGLLNNIYPCHLDWHYDSYQIYREAKANILKHAKHKIVHGDISSDSEVASIEGEKIYFDTKGRYTYDSKGFFIDERYIYTGPINLLGNHNKVNITAVISILASIIQDTKKIHETLEQVLPEFSSLPMRQENIGVYEGITFINDAAATTPESSIAAIETFSPELQTLFIGGQDSGFDTAILRKKIIDSSIENIVAFPDTSEVIFPEIRLRDDEVPFEIDIEGKNIHFLKTRSMQSAVDFAYKTTLPGRIALLSTAAPSFSVWKNREQKSEEFVSAVQKY